MDIMHRVTLLIPAVSRVVASAATCFHYPPPPEKFSEY